MVSFSIFARTVFCLATVAGISACVDGIVVEPISQSAISSDFTVVSIDPVDAGADTHVFIKVQDSYGYAEVCGAIVTSGTAELAGIKRKVQNLYYVVLNDDLILNNLQLLNIVAPPETPQSAHATCIATDIIWRPTYDGAMPELRRRSD